MGFSWEIGPIKKKIKSFMAPMQLSRLWSSPPDFHLERSATKKITGSLPSESCVEVSMTSYRRFTASDSPLRIEGDFGKKKRF